MKKVFAEFRQFAVKGSVIDLAVGIIIGGAFQKIVSSLVDDLLMPPIGLVLGKVDFADLFVPLDRPKWELLRTTDTDGVISLAEAKQAGLPVLAYGQFINNCISFIIVAFAVFMLVRGINRLKASVEEPPAAGEPVTKECPYCLSTIPVKATRCAQCTSEVPIPTTA